MYLYQRMEINRKSNVFLHTKVNDWRLTAHRTEKSICANCEGEKPAQAVTDGL